MLQGALACRVGPIAVFGRCDRTARPPRDSSSRSLPPCVAHPTDRWIRHRTGDVARTGYYAPTRQSVRPLVGLVPIGGCLLLRCGKQIAPSPVLCCCRSAAADGWGGGTNKTNLRPQIRREYPLNLSILISGGKETNKDSLSNGE